VDELTEESKEQNGRLEACGRTDIGRHRPHNEDSIVVAKGLSLFAVADGMGGHAAGEVASRTAVEALENFITQTSTDHDFTWPFGMDKNYDFEENILLTAIHLANRKVCQVASENQDYAGMGTTMAAIYAPEARIHIGHVGDSRVYRLRERRLELLTMDHSWVNEQLQRNVITEDEARNHRWRNVITRALGNRSELEVDLQTVEPLAGDRFLICSDGLTGMLRDEEIAEILNRCDDDLEEACDTLVEASNAAGGMDNISVVLVRVQP
jgi:PPM family protein phosphatase